MGFITRPIRLVLLPEPGKLNNILLCLVDLAQILLLLACELGLKLELLFLEVDFVLLHLNLYLGDLESFFIALFTHFGQFC